MTGSALVTTSPSSSIWRRRTPWVEGCDGPIESDIFSVSNSPCGVLGGGVGKWNIRRAWRSRRQAPGFGRRSVQLSSFARGSASRQVDLALRRRRTGRPSSGAAIAPVFGLGDDLRIRKRRLDAGEREILAQGEMRDSRPTSGCGAGRDGRRSGCRTCRRPRARASRPRARGRSTLGTSGAASSGAVSRDADVLVRRGGEDVVDDGEPRRGPDRPVDARDVDQHVEPVLVPAAPAGRPAGRPPAH